MDEIHQQAEVAVKALENTINWASVFIQTGDHIHNPHVYDDISFKLGRTVDLAIAMNALPSPAHLSQLLRIVDAVYRSKAKLPQPSLLSLMLPIKAACQTGWFPDEDKNHLILMAKKVSYGFSNLDRMSIDPANAYSHVSYIISRFYPRMKIEHILTSFDVKAGYGTFVVDFLISRGLFSHQYQDLWLLVARIDNMDTAACIATPSNVNFYINRMEVPKRTKSDMGEGPQLPSDVTKMIKYGVNLLEVFGDFDGQYIIALAVLNPTSPPDPPLLQDYVRPMSDEVDSDCEIVNVASLISLKCPISQIRITTPVKGHLCKHPQCFDYDGFMENNSVWPTWKCPVCKKSVCNLDIRIDQTFLKILNEVANTVTDVILSEDGSWIFATTENSQTTKTNKDGLSQNNQTPDTAGKTTSIDSNEALPSSSPALHRSSGSESSSTAEQPSTMTMPAMSPPILQDCCLQLKGSHDMLHMPAPIQRISNHLNPDNLHTNEPINGLNNASQSDHNPDTAENTSSIQANEVLPISSPALHNSSGSANSLTAEQSQGSHDVHIAAAAEQSRHQLDPENLPTLQVSCASKNQSQNVHKANTTGNIEANAALPNSSSALDNSGGSANSLIAEKLSTLHQSTIITPAVPLPRVLKDSCLQSQGSDDMIITPPSVQKIRNHADLVNLQTTQPSYGVSNRIQNEHAPDTSKNAISMEAIEALPHSSSVLHDSDGSANRSYAELPSTLRQSTVTMPAVSPQVLKDSCLQSQGSYDIQKPPSVQQLSHHPNTVNLPTAGPSYGLTNISHLSSQSQPLQHQTDRATQAHPGPSMTKKIRSSMYTPVELPPSTSASLHSTALASEHLIRAGEKRQYTARGQPRKGISTANNAQCTTSITPSATSSQQPITLTSEQFMRGITERQYRPRGRPRMGIATTEQPQSSPLVTPSATSSRSQQPMTLTSEKLMKGDGPQHNTSPGETQVNVGTTKQTQDTTMFTPVVPAPHSAPALAHAANIRPLSPIRHPKPSGDTMPSGIMKGSLTGKDREAAEMTYLSPPSQPRWPTWTRPTLATCTALPMQQSHTDSPNVSNSGHLHR
uniref:putative GPI-anchored protein pfl2 n=1 Tax=Erigeron canadensis TaxID=72917 RepID=UPI001CB89BC4|nr:putative GPI-anchored protein pfl2 [Erigeron canadensis]